MSREERKAMISPSRCDLSLSRQCELVSISRSSFYYTPRGENAFIESFNGRLRDELLNETLFRSLGHAREALAIWKHDYNTVRPHSAIGNVPPATYAKLSEPAMQRAGPLEQSRGSAPRPVASPSQHGSNEERALLPTG